MDRLQRSVIGNRLAAHQLRRRRSSDKRSDAGLGNADTPHGRDIRAGTDGGVSGVSDTRDGDTENDSGPVAGEDERTDERESQRGTVID